MLHSDDHRCLSSSSRCCSDRTGECVEEKPCTHACKERNSAQSPTGHGGKPRNGNGNASTSTSTSRAGQAGGRPSGEARAVANRHRASRTAPRPCWWHQMYIESNQEEANRVTYSTYSPTGTASRDAVTGLSHYKPREAITPSRRRAQAPPPRPAQLMATPLCGVRVIDAPICDTLAARCGAPAIGSPHVRRSFA